MLCKVIRLPSDFALTIGWMCLWWSGLRILFIFCVHSWITLLESAVTVFAPFLNYIYSRFISTRDDDVHLLLGRLKNLLSLVMFLLCVDGVFQIMLIYAAYKKSYMLMLPWIVYSFVSLIFLTVLPLDYYSNRPATQATNFDGGMVSAINQMSSYFIYLAIQTLLLIFVFHNFQKLRFNKSYYYLKQALDIEKDMIMSMLELYEKTILNRLKNFGKCDNEDINTIEWQPFKKVEFANLKFKKENGMLKELIL